MSIENELLDVKQVAEVSNCSQRTIFRLSADGRMPKPIKLGALVRWNRTEIETWIAGGCKPIETEAGKGAEA